MALELSFYIYKKILNFKIRPYGSPLLTSMPQKSPQTLNLLGFGFDPNLVAIIKKDASLRSVLGPILPNNRDN